jgi:iron complex transport system ATP-binding protein
MSTPRRTPSSPPPPPRPHDARPRTDGAGPDAAAPTGERSRLRTESATIGYDGRIISRELSVEIPDGSFTAIIGPNGCGKSTMLRALARILAPSAGRVLLDGEEIGSRPPKEVARRLGLLPQTSLAPDGIRVADLVARGRAPYQGLFQQWRAEDEAAVSAALEATRLTDLSGRLVEELSGGQRQRVWVAMLLAQGTDLMLLDEPTTFLDIAHQYELMELLRGFHEEGRTLVAVLHDLGQAARYADHLIVMHEGRVVTTGPPAEVITAELVERVFGLRCLVVPDPVTGTPTVVPLDPRTAPIAPAEDPSAAGPAPETTLQEDPA